MQRQRQWQKLQRTFRHNPCHYNELTTRIDTASTVLEPREYTLAQPVVKPQKAVPAAVSARPEIPISS